MFELKLLKDALDKWKKACYMEDWIDRAHYFVTANLLFTICLIVGSKQLWGQPMSCMVGAENPKAWVSYVNSYCFATNTFMLSNSMEEMPQDEMMDRVKINYYQWVPYALMLQAVLFYLPHLFWCLARESWTEMNFKHLVDKCVTGRAMPLKEREKEIRDVVHSLAKVSEHRQIKENSLGLGSVGTAVYFAYKCLNILNVVAQIMLLYFFIGGPGWSVSKMGNALQTAYSNETGFFPRTTFCTFKQNALTDGLQVHTVQCVLTLNFVYEKIFALLYIWLAVLLVLSVLNVLYVFLRYVSPVGLRHSSKRYLNPHPQRNRVDWRKFADLQLDHDGLLLLRFIENNAGFLIASDVACKFYDTLRKPTVSVQSGLNHDAKDQIGEGKKLKTMFSGSVDGNSGLYPPKA